MMQIGQDGTDWGRTRRRLTLIPIIAVHVAVILWILHARESLSSLSDSASPALFEPFLPETPPPPPPVRKPDPTRSCSRAACEEPGARAAGSASASAREMMDVSLSPLAPPAATPLPTTGITPLDLGIGSLAGVGAGRGAGNGSGDGRGDGDGSGSTTYARAEWIRRPPPSAYRQHWPLGQTSLAQTAVVRLACAVDRDGRPGACRVDSESPAGMNFGSAAQRIVREGRLRPMAENGTVRWDLPVLVSISFDTVDTAPAVPRRKRDPIPEPLGPIMLPGGG